MFLVSIQAAPLARESMASVLTRRLAIAYLVLALKMMRIVRNLEVRWTATFKFELILGSLDAALQNRAMQVVATLSQLDPIRFNG